MNGSSPRVRGTFFVHAPVQLRSRFIPACAGNIPLFSLTNELTAVHPRVCGEHKHSITGMANMVGSSPRVRGTLNLKWNMLLCYRFIPACAGNIRFACYPCRISAVHPRVCGEHVNVGRERLAAVGSSPRVRGTFPTLQRGNRYCRFIPACAGNISHRRRG